MSDVMQFVSQRPLITLDRRAFIKTKDERKTLRVYKMMNRDDRRAAYGSYYKRYLNVPEKSLPEKLVFSL